VPLLVEPWLWQRLWTAVSTRVVCVLRSCTPTKFAPLSLISERHGVHRIPTEASALGKPRDGRQVGIRGVILGYLLYIDFCLVVSFGSVYRSESISCFVEQLLVLCPLFSNLSFSKYLPIGIVSRINLLDILPCGAQRAPRSRKVLDKRITTGRAQRVRLLSEGIPAYNEPY
jgi:hypothetical protein